MVLLHETPTPKTCAPWQPLAGAALLDALRGGRSSRPSVEGAFALRVRGELSDRCGELLGTSDVAPLTLDRGTVARGYRLSERGDLSVELLRHIFTSTIFQIQVHAGPSADAIEDAKAVLEADPSRRPLLEYLATLAPAVRRELRDAISSDARHLAERWPSLNPMWLPRTGVSMAVDLDGGRVRLRGTCDLMVGIPNRSSASVCMVSLKTTPLTSFHRDEARYLALVETARCGVPPFRIATYSTATGELHAEYVTEALLKDAMEHTLAAVTAPAGVPAP